MKFCSVCGVALAQQNEPVAQYNLGEMFRHGLGRPIDASIAFTWFSKSAANGFANAQFILGTHYENGMVVPRNEAEALKWYKLAAQQGHRDAQSRVASLDPQARARSNKIQECYNRCQAPLDDCLMRYIRSSKAGYICEGFISCFNVCDAM